MNKYHKINHYFCKILSQISHIFSIHSFIFFFITRIQSLLSSSLPLCLFLLLLFSFGFSSQPFQHLIGVFFYDGLSVQVMGLGTFVFDFLEFFFGQSLWYFGFGFLQFWWAVLTDCRVSINFITQFFQINFQQKLCILGHLNFTSYFAYLFLYHFLFSFSNFMRNFNNTIKLQLLNTINNLLLF